MKLKTGVILTKMQDETVAVAVGEAGSVFKGMIKMNETAAFLAEHLQNEQTEDGLVSLLLSEYRVSEEDARRNVRYVVAQLTKIGLIDQ